MKSLLLVAHGSRRAESNLEIARLAARLAEHASAEFELVEHAFLELAEPLIPDGIERCIARGATSVNVVPYFLARGTHVAEDIPQQVAIKQAQYPAMAIRITDYLGTADELVNVLLKLARQDSVTGKR
jgi:sirohydrochlorin ferrochelatase